MKPSLTSSLLAATILLGASAPAFADAETDALRLEVKALLARVDQLEKRQKTAQNAAALEPAAGKPATKSVTQRLAVVERNQELAQEDAKLKAETSPKVEMGNGKGFTITSADKQYAFGVRAYAQADYRGFFDKQNTGATSTFLVRTARPIFDAKMTDYFNARLMWDFGQGNSRLLDGYVDFHPLPGKDIVNLRVGQQKSPVGIERWESEQDTTFVERGQTTNLVPQRELGASAYGQIILDQLEYQVGLGNGASDLQINTADTDSSKDVFGRLFAHPLRWSGIKALSGLGFGVAGTYGQHQGTASSPGLTTGYLTTGQRTYFTYRAAAGQVVFADGSQWRLNPQVLYYNGPFGFIGEYVRNTQEVTRSTSSATLNNDAWLANVSYVLTGEDAAFDGVKPLHNFDPRQGQWGAFEAVARFSQLSVDKKAFPFYADNTVSSRSAKEWGVGGTWYFNPNVKLNLDYAQTAFDAGALGGVDRPDEKVVLARTQFRF
jgi:phosphate-selective porin OprO/OprP